MVKYITEEEYRSTRRRHEFLITKKWIQLRTDDGGITTSEMPATCAQWMLQRIEGIEQSLEWYKLYQPDEYAVRESLLAPVLADWHRGLAEEIARLQDAFDRGYLSKAAFKRAIRLPKEPKASTGIKLSLKPLKQAENAKPAA